MLPSLPEDDSSDKNNNRGDGWGNGTPPSDKMTALKRGPGKEQDEGETITGVLVGRVVRGYYTTINLIVVGDTGATAVSDDEEDQYHVLVRIQYNDANDDTITENSTTVKELRSYFRRYCKNGDLLHIRRGTYQDAAEPQKQSAAQTTVEEEESWRDPRFVVTVYSVEDAQQSVQLLQGKYWGMSQWQAWQEKLYRCEQKQKQCQNKNAKHKQKKNKSKSTSTGESEESSCMAHHTGGLEKRQQATMVANFLLQMIMAQMKIIKGDITNKCHDGENDNHGTVETEKTGSAGVDTSVNEDDPSTWSNPLTTTTTSVDDDAAQRIAAAIEYLNGGSGVLDVAGGSGHVSMALGMLGIQSTVVDPREAVGKLPGRDRKLWNRALKKSSSQQVRQTKPKQQQDTTLHSSFSVDLDTKTSNSVMFCQPTNTPVRPFQTLRAWFGTPPPGVDTNFRNPDNANVRVCDSEHPAVQNCRAIVALHPDEATDAIVDMAVKRKIPLVIVPCCVFCRLFPQRRMPSNNNTRKKLNRSREQGATVSTYQDLLDYLQAKDDYIQRATLPFVGANTVLFRPLLDQEEQVVSNKD